MTEGKFWAKVAKSDEKECWPWLGYIGSSGYGSVGVSKKKKVAAHRLAWEYANGPIPDGLFVLHKCDNRPCCNPAHLFLGTAGDNIQDCVAKGRHAAHVHPGWCRGERSPAAKITATDAAQMRERYASGGIRQRDIAAQVGLSISATHSILTGQHWEDASGPITLHGRGWRKALTPKQEEVLFEEWCRGRFSKAAIGRLFGVGPTVVAKTIARMESERGIATTHRYRRTAAVGRR